MASGDILLQDRAWGLTKTNTIIFIASSLLFGIIMCKYLFYNIVILTAGAMIGRVGTNIIGAVLVGQGEVVKDKITKIVFSVAMLTSQYFLLKYGFGVQSLPVSIYIGLSCQLIVFILCTKVVGNIISKGRFSFRWFINNKIEHVNWLFYTLPALFIYNFQIFGLRLWANPPEVVIFSVAHQIFYGLISVCSISSYLSGPVISRLNYISIIERNNIVLANVKIVTILSAVTLSQANIWLPVVQSNFFYNVDLSSYKFTWIAYSLLILIELWQMSLVNALIFSGHTNFKLVNVMSAVINILLCYKLIPYCGLNGAIISIVIAQMFTCNVFNVIKAIKILRLSYKVVILFVVKSVSYFLFIVIAHNIILYNEYHNALAWNIYIFVCISILVIYAIWDPIMKIVNNYNKLDINL